jgi:hypothetical protein
LRAGLLSDREVIARLNEGFVCTSLIIDEVNARAENGDELAKTLAANWRYPLEIMFLTPQGKLISRMNSFEDFPGVHPDVGAPPRHEKVSMENERSHIDVFLTHVSKHFNKQ